MTDTLIVTERPHHCIIRVWHGEDWYDPMPRLVQADGVTPWDLTDVTIELFVRPSLDHATRFLWLTSEASAGIVKESAADGEFAFVYAQGNVEDNLPLTRTPAGWEQFLRFTFDDPDLGIQKKIFWTGPMFVLPAKDTA